MNTLYYILFFAAGIAVDMLYNRSKRIAAQNAYLQGFKHAKREEEKYFDGVNDGIRNGMPRYTDENPVETPDQKLLVPGYFMDHVHENGHATMKLE